MEPFVENPPVWDLSHTSSFSQLADDDFLALLQKQFPTESPGVNHNSVYSDGINPRNISRYSLPSMTPPSEDSSPSPPNMNDPGSNDDGADPVLKRKASDDSIEGGPSQKTQHTANSKKSTTTSRRKSIGASGPPKDETRLLKRKEQNRAAQRAFRERKEKHVKDLEDKVAALEAKNEQAASENENLRDLLSRLQSENLSLKQSSFTFSVPKSAGGGSPENAQASTSFASQSPAFSSRPSASSPRTSPSVANPLEWSSLTTFDPAVLNLLDDSPQQTATDGAMQMDFGFGSNTGLSDNTPYTTIASNPMFMSFASTFDADSPSNGTSDSNNFSSFDVSGLTSWPTPPTNTQDGSLDDLLAGYMPRGPVDYSYLPPSSTASESPVAHHANHVSTTAASHSPSFSSTSSPSSSVSDPLFDSHRDSSSESDVGHEGHNEKECPKTKGELVRRIVDSGPSPFAPTVRKGSDAMLGPVITCEGTSFPKTQLSDKNVEVLKAWRSITSNPQYKDVDINELCTEFTNKARCDGTKVVLEPQGVDCILRSLSSMKK